MGGKIELKGDDGYTQYGLGRQTRRSLLRTKRVQTVEVSVTRRVDFGGGDRVGGRSRGKGGRFRRS